VPEQGNPLLRLSNSFDLCLADQIPTFSFITGHARDLDLITNAGFRFVRMDFSWEATERKAGVYV
jgi:hypothetical protein